MSLASVSIKRPIFITCLIIVMLVVGAMCMQKLPVDLFPDVNFPFVTVTTIYPGAGPTEIETLVSKPIEDELITISGIKRVTSANVEGASRVFAQFTLETDIKYAEQQVRDRVSSVKPKLPLDIKEPVIRRIDPADQPIISISFSAELPEGKLFDLADETIRPKLEQVNQVGLVVIQGGRKREIKVFLDRNRLRGREMSVSSVARALSMAGENIPSGRVNEGKTETAFRALGEFKSLGDIQNTIVSLFGNDIPTKVSDLGSVEESLEDETSQAFVNGKKSLLIQVFRQSGANTVAVADAVKKQVEKIKLDLKGAEGNPQMDVVRDGANWIRINVDDMKDSIGLGIFLTVIVVFFFLANGRSTIITGLALPNSLLGAFILMTVAGFTVNIVTLLALSLSVGLLIDDAIVVRENIFRHIELGRKPIEAALEGTKEVSLAVIATTLSVMAVFGPIAFMKGMTGQFFRQFGLTIVFAMGISLFDALTIAPMLSAYFAGSTHSKRTGIWGATVGKLVDGFEKFQKAMERFYGRVLEFTLTRPLTVLGISLVVFVLSMASVAGITKTFFPPQDQGEFTATLDMVPGTNLQAMADMAHKVDEVIRANKEVHLTALTVGGRNGEPNQASFYVHLVPAKERKLNTLGFKEKLREELKPYSEANPLVKDFDPVGAGGQRPFMLNVIGYDQAELEKAAEQVGAIVRAHPGLKDVDSTYRPGKPEFQIELKPGVSETYGVSSKIYGAELRAQVEGTVPAKYRERGREYDVRVRLKDDQRNLRDAFAEIYVPNVNNKIIRLRDVATPRTAIGPSTINRYDRGRYIQFNADLAPGAGLGDVMNDVVKRINSEVKMPPGTRYAFMGNSEDFQEFGQAMGTAILLSVIFIFLVLSSLYESFVTPLTIMLALPLAVCGAMVALLVARESINLFSMIGVIMLLGVASKNSILLVDYAHQLIREGMSRKDALMKAGTTRLRPILMTTMALIAGTLPIALGLNEASRQRTSMGVAIIGGLISSTILTLVVVPAAFSYIDRFRLWSKGVLSKRIASSPSGVRQDRAARI